MRFTAIVLATILMIFTFGCGGSTPENTNAPANTTNAGPSNTAPETANAANTGDPLGTRKTPEIATTNEAPTLTPVVKAYCEAIVKKDEAGLRKVHSQETLKVLEADMKSENITSLVQFISDLDPIKDVSKCGARNEEIKGDTAVAEIRNENMPGLRVKFVKENGEWKLTNVSPDIPKK